MMDWALSGEILPLSMNASTAVLMASGMRSLGMSGAGATKVGDSKRSVRRKPSDVVRQKPRGPQSGERVGIATSVPAEL